MRKSLVLCLAFFLLLVLTFSFISADFGYDNPSLPNIEEEQIITYRNITTYNVNSTDFWDSLDTPANINHNTLAGLQGGQAGEYYHLNQSFFDELISDIFNWITQTEGDARYLQSYTESDPHWTGNWSSYLPLTDNSMADILHRHSELSASDGTPDQALFVDSAGKVGIGTATPAAGYKLEVKGIIGAINDADWIGIETGESLSKMGGMYWRNTVERLELAGTGFDYPVLIQNSLFIDTDTNSGNVGIGTLGPDASLEVINGTTNGGFMVSSAAEANGDLFIVDELGNVGIGTASPSYPLEISRDVSGISLWTSANISATGYNTRTSVFDTSKSVWDYIKDASYYLTDKKIDHTKFYGYAGSFLITDYSRPINESYIVEVCEEVIVKNETIQECHNETEYRITYPYTKEEKQVSINKEIDLLRQGIYELKVENDLMKQSLCKLGEIQWC